MRQRSHKELSDRLLRAGFDDEEVAEVSERLQRVGLMDDERFARDLAARWSRSRGMGRRRIASELFAKGIGRQTIDEVLQPLGDGEEARAEAIARSRAVRLSSLAPAVAYRRLLSLLLRRGFDAEMSRAICRRVLEPDACS